MKFPTNGKLNSGEIVIDRYPANQKVKSICSTFGQLREG